MLLVGLGRVFGLRGALGPPSHSASILRHISLISGLHLRQRLRRWSRVCLSPEPHHQQLSVSTSVERGVWAAVRIAVLIAVQIAI